MSNFEWVAALFVAASTLAIILVFDHARHDEKPPTPVSLADRSTWRRKPDFWRAHWGHLVGAPLALAGVALLIAAL